ncbi:S-layer homology domain-containing protein [Paenibacillus sp. CF095]|uniref:S-layer homology domain-containing protein n=1 Tax=Paenibacillus sp. CF095 TaxID=1881033 RepID=UPI00088335BC|nr:S-layer homology domain-containing protein [Paenibacillus sp. CF095]SDD48686.1 S-layer homology domain-containing protein [Paenibacillus sp. CF095]
MKKMIISGVTALALLTGGIVGVEGVGSSVQAAQATLKFKDVPSTHWAAAAINSAVEQGYFKGYTDGTFKPSSPVTKAEMASILGRLSDQPNASSPGINNFTDVPEWAVGGVSAAIQKGFINPTSYQGKLDAKASLKRGEMAIWLTQGLATVDLDYKQALSDVKNTVIPAKEYFTGNLATSQKNAVAVAMGTGLMSVYNDKMFGADRTTTRAEVAVLIARYGSVAKTKPSNYKGLNELRQVGLTGTNINIIAPKYKKTPENKVSPNVDYSEVTDDFTKVRNKNIITDTQHADLKIKNWIIVNTFAKGTERSIYYPVFVDEGFTLLRGAYYSFPELELNVKNNNMNRLQAGSLLNSATINPMNSPTSDAFAAYGGPVINDFTKNRGVFAVKNPVYWSRGLLHFDKEILSDVSLVSKEGPTYSVIATD